MTAFLAEQTTSASTQPSPPNTGATTFEAVSNTAEARSGTTLMVEAYAIIWTILMVWLLLLWRKQNGINTRIDGLEKAIDRAALLAEKKGAA